MNHRNSVKKIGKDHKHKKAILKNMALSILRHEKIKTTVPKAKIFRSFIEKIITRAKVDSLHSRRLVYRDIKNTLLLKKLFENIATRYKDRNGGYTRIIRVGQRKGDGAEMCYVCLVEENLNSNSNINQTNTNNEKKKSAKVKESNITKLVEVNSSKDTKTKGNNVLELEEEETKKEEVKELSKTESKLDEISTQKEKI